MSQTFGTTTRKIHLWGKKSLFFSGITSFIKDNESKTLPVVSLVAA